MATANPLSPLLLKGALIELTDPFLGLVPNVIVFQYNPETITRSLTPWQPPPEPEGGGEEVAPGLAQPYDPEEGFTLTLRVDATDALAEPLSHPAAAVSGVADRLAALEQLLYPTGDSLLPDLGAALVGALTGDKPPEPRREVPVILLFLGPGRIVPVRITSFQITEQQFSSTLYPIRAEVALGVRVLTPAAFEDPLTVPKELAIAAYRWTRGQKEVLAIANLTNSVESILGMLPF